MSNRLLNEMLQDTSHDLASTVVMSPELLPISMFMEASALEPLTNNIHQLFHEYFKIGRIDFIGRTAPDGTLAGYFAAMHLPHEMAYITRIYVKPEYQGQGLGLSLLSEADRRYKTISLLCTDGLTGFYEKAGFKQKGYYSQNSEDFKINDSAFEGLAVMHKNRGSNELDGALGVFRLLDSDIMPHVLKGVGVSA